MAIAAIYGRGERTTSAKIHRSTETLIEELVEKPEPVRPISTVRGLIVATASLASAAPGRLILPHLLRW